MKKILFAALAATTLFASCAKEGENNGVEGSPATLNISIASTGTRAILPDGTGELAAGYDKTVSNFYVFVLDGVGNVITKQAVSSTSVSLNTTTSATEVYVVANEETAYDVATLANITTKAGLEALEVNLTTANGGEQIDKRWITGSTSSVTWSAPGVGLATVDLSYIASRITVKIVNEMTGYDHATATATHLKLESVTVLNANGTSKLFGASLVPATLSFYAGMAFPTAWANEPVLSTVYSELTDAFTYTSASVNDFYDGSSNKNVFYYYVFGRDAVTAAIDFPTIVTLCGTYDGQDVYFPVHLAEYDIASLTSGLERGKSYDITMTLKGDPTIGGGGTIDPTQPVITATLSVSLEVTDWTPVIIGKEFN